MTTDPIVLHRGPGEGTAAVTVDGTGTTPDPSLGGWGIADVIHDRLSWLGVPVLGGLSVGHGSHRPRCLTRDTVAT
ncbi:hypothetical protein GCM10009682_34570 [Luedemannella flava]|uniref:Uncharacterized protein n=1 Tax=Luedemannella flava TaxID=349316 RepID=A0ABN2M518_9ACTN